jgi:hypothetical protein
MSLCQWFAVLAVMEDDIMSGQRVYELEIAELSISYFGK